MTNDKLLCLRQKLLFRRQILRYKAGVLLFLVCISTVYITSLISVQSIIGASSPVCPFYGSAKASMDNLEPTALASFPGSGNTWLRYLIEQSTGYMTGSEYYDQELHEAGLLGEMGALSLNESNGSHVLVVKTHGSDEWTKRRYTRVVLLVRHPEAAILAEFHRQYGGGHQGLASEGQSQKYWRDFCEIHARAWAQFHLDWENYNGSMLVVTYEDLMAHPILTVHRITQFLQVNVTDLDITCALDKSAYLKRRKHSNLTPHRCSNVDKIRQMYDIFLGKFILKKGIEYK